MKKYFQSALWSITLFALYSILYTASAHAEGEFSTTLTTRYEVLEQGKTVVSYTITLTNLLSTIHAVSYSFVTRGVTPSNVKAEEAGQEISVNSEQTNDNATTLTVNFLKPLVGKGKSRTFTLSYEDSKLAGKNGQVWEVVLPKVENIAKYESYNITLAVPKSFGEPAYITPQPTFTSIEVNNNLYQFSGEIAGSGVVAAFGTFQVFGFEFSYHLKNPNIEAGETEIALPPDTAFQRMYYTALVPRPRSIRLDEDGNWLASYRLKAQEVLDVKARGAVQLFASPQDFYPHTTPDIAKYLEPTKYWQTKDSQVISSAQRLKTAREIYQFVVETLRYDYSRVKEGVERLGALKALDNPESAICMEFTDLFIALSRAAGIPAREVNGYAHTENPQLQPLSLVADVLHSWPEYWDGERGIWVPVDPTWGNTTGGVDYFSKLDLAHFAFVIHGTDPEEPYPAGSYKLAENPQKDVTVFFDSLPPQISDDIELLIGVKNSPLPFFPSKGTVSIKNNRPTALYNLTPKLLTTSGIIEKATTTIPFIAPFSTQELSFVWKPKGLLPQRGELLAFVGDKKISYTIGTEILVWRILGIFIILTILVGGILTLLRLKINDHVKSFIPHKFPWRLPF